MRYIGITALLCVALTLVGCSPQQKAEAHSNAEQAKQQIRQSTQKLNKEMTDEEIALKLKTAMATSDKLNTSGVKVFVKNRVLTLVGTVADSSQKALADRIAKDTVGKDVRVIDKLQVAPSTK